MNDLVDWSEDWATPSGLTIEKQTKAKTITSCDNAFDQLHVGTRFAINKEPSK